MDKEINTNIYRERLFTLFTVIPAGGRGGGGGVNVGGGGLFC